MRTLAPHWLAPPSFESSLPLPRPKTTISAIVHRLLLHRVIAMCRECALPSRTREADIHTCLRGWGRICESVICHISGSSELCPFTAYSYKCPDVESILAVYLDSLSSKFEAGCICNSGPLSVVASECPNSSKCRSPRHGLWCTRSCWSVLGATWASIAPMLEVARRASAYYLWSCLAAKHHVPLHVFLARIHMRASCYVVSSQLQSGSAPASMGAGVGSIGFKLCYLRLVRDSPLTKLGWLLLTVGMFG